MKRLFTLILAVLATVSVNAENRMVQYQTWFGDSMGATSESTATKRIEYFYDSNNQLIRKVQTGLMEDGCSWLMTNYYLMQYDKDGQLAMTNSLQYGIYDQGHYSLRATNDTITYSYNEKGQLLEEKVQAKKTATLYTYDEEGRVVKAEIYKSGKLSQTLTYSDFTLGGAQTVQSEATASYNCYEGKMTYDQWGNKTSERRYNTSGVLTAAEYWTYDEQGKLSLYEKKGISGGEEIDSQKTTYAAVDEYTTRSCSYTYSSGEWKKKGGSVCETTMADFDATSATQITAVSPDAENSTVSLTLTIPEALVGKASLIIYRNGLSVDTLQADAQTIAYTDQNIENGEHEYFAQTIIDGKNGNISNIEVASLTRSYPRAMGLRALQATRNTDGLYMVTLGWNAPEITEDMQFVNYNILKVGKYYSTPLLEEEEAVTDPKATKVEVSFGIDPVLTIYLQTRFHGATLTSDTITVDANLYIGKTSEDARKLRTVETWGDAQGYDTGITKKEVTYYGNDNRVKRVARYAKTLGTDGNDPANWTIYEYDVNVYGESGMLEKQYTRQYGLYDHGQMGFRDVRDTIRYENNVEGQMLRKENMTGYTEYEYTEDGSLAKEYIVEYAVPNNFEQTITYSNFAGKDKPTQTVSTGTRSSQQYMLETEYDENGRKVNERKSSFKTSTQTYVPNQVQEFYYNEGGELSSDTVFTIKIVNDIEQYSYKSYTTYVPEEGNTNRVTVVKRVWDNILKKFGNPKTWNVYEYADINAEKYSPTLTAEPMPEKVNTVTLTVDVPTEQRTSMTAFNVYRDGMEIAHAIGYFDTEHYATDEYGMNGVWTYTDSCIANGKHDYFVEYAQLNSTMTGIEKYSNISNVALVEFNTELPRPTGLREASRNYTTTENTEEGTTELNVFVNLEWDAPENASDYGLTGYEVMLVGSQIAENYDIADKTPTTYELSMRGIKEMKVYVDAIYPIGRASSDTIVVNEIADAINLIESLNTASSKRYNLRGQQADEHTKGIVITRKKKVVKP